MTWRLVVLLSFVTAGSGNVAAQAPCPVEGTWELVSVTVDGRQQLRDGFTQIKLVTATHFAFVGQRGGTAHLQSVADTLAAYRTRISGGGTYRVTPSSYTERLDFNSNPEYIGREISFSCRVEGGRWYHAADFPLLQGGTETGSIRLEEVWRRIG